MDSSQSKSNYKRLEESNDLNKVQSRLLRSLNHTLNQIISTNNEQDFFFLSSEAMRLLASLIKQSNFQQNHNKSFDIPYADQAIEFSIDSLIEKIQNKKYLHFDN